MEVARNVEHWIEGRSSTMLSQVELLCFICPKFIFFLPKSRSICCLCTVCRLTLLLIWCESSLHVKLSKSFLQPDNSYIGRILIPCFRIDFQSYAFSWTLTLTLKKAPNLGSPDRKFPGRGGKHGIYGAWKHPRRIHRGPELVSTVWHCMHSLHFHTRYLSHIHIS